VVEDKPLSCRASVTGMVSVAECLHLETETEAVPMELHNLHLHVLDLHDKAVEDH
jgi:hypothetical protein